MFSRNEKIFIGVGVVALVACISTFVFSLTYLASQITPEGVGELAGRVVEGFKEATKQ